MNNLDDGRFRFAIYLGEETMSLPIYMELVRDGHKPIYQNDRNFVGYVCGNSYDNALQKIRQNLLLTLSDKRGLGK
jgi:hypothetical protein